MGRRRGDPQRNFLEHDDVRDLRTGALALLYGASYSHIDVADAFPAGTGKKVVLITGANRGIGGRSADRSDTNRNSFALVSCRDLALGREAVARSPADDGRVGRGAPAATAGHL